MLQKRLGGFQNATPIGLARQLDVKPSDLQAKQERQQTLVIHVGAVSGIVIAARTRVHANLLLLRGAESIEHAVIQIDE